MQWVLLNNRFINVNFLMQCSTFRRELMSILSWIHSAVIPQNKGAQNVKVKFNKVNARLFVDVVICSCSNW